MAACRDRYCTYYICVGYALQSLLLDSSLGLYGRMMLLKDKDGFQPTSVRSSHIGLPNTGYTKTAPKS